MLNIWEGRERDVQAICHPRHAVDVVYDPAGDGLQQAPGEFVSFGTHEVTGGYGAKAVYQVSIALDQRGREKGNRGLVLQLT